MEIRISVEDQIRLDGYFQFPHLFEVVDCSTRPPLSFVFFTFTIFLRIRQACSLLILHANLGRKLITTTPNLLILL